MLDWAGQPGRARAREKKESERTFSRSLMLREVSVMRMRCTLASSSIFLAPSILERWLGDWSAEITREGSAERC